MTVPQQYTLAQKQFDRFMADAMATLDQDTTHRAYHTIVGVLRAFRRTLSVEQALRFADVLPAILRAIFVAEWAPGLPRVSYASRAEMLAEVRAFQRHHNFAPDNAIEAVGATLRRHVDEAEFDRVLASLPPSAVAFWSGGLTSS